jgi:hypothetical protein
VIFYTHFSYSVLCAIMLSQAESHLSWLNS